MEVTNIFKSFNAGFYKVDLKTVEGKLMTGRATAKGLASVGKRNTSVYQCCRQRKQDPLPYCFAPGNWNIYGHMVFCCSHDLPECVCFWG
jgi:hypothetical protein